MDKTITLAVLSALFLVIVVVDTVKKCKKENKTK